MVLTFADGAVYGNDDLYEKPEAERLLAEMQLRQAAAGSRSGVWTLQEVSDE